MNEGMLDGVDSYLYSLVHHANDVPNTQPLRTSRENEDFTRDYMPPSSNNILQVNNEFRGGNFNENPSPNFQDIRSNLPRNNYQTGVIYDSRPNRFYDRAYTQRPEFNNRYRWTGNQYPNCPQIIQQFNQPVYFDSDYQRPQNREFRPPFNEHSKRTNYPSSFDFNRTRPPDFFVDSYIPLSNRNAGRSFQGNTNRGRRRDNKKSDRHVSDSFIPLSNRRNCKSPILKQIEIDKSISEKAVPPLLADRSISPKPVPPPEDNRPKTPEPPPPPVITQPTTPKSTSASEIYQPISPTPFSSPETSLKTKSVKVIEPTLLETEVSQVNIDSFFVIDKTPLSNPIITKIDGKDETDGIDNSEKNKPDKTADDNVTVSNIDVTIPNKHITEPNNLITVPSIYLSNFLIPPGPSAKELRLIKFRLDAEKRKARKRQNRANRRKEIRKQKNVQKMNKKAKAQTVVSQTPIPVINLDTDSNDEDNDVVEIPRSPIPLVEISDGEETAQAQEAVFATPKTKRKKRKNDPPPSRMSTPDSNDFMQSDIANLEAPVDSPKRSEQPLEYETESSCASDWFGNTSEIQPHELNSSETSRFTELDLVHFENLITPTRESRSSKVQGKSKENITEVSFSGNSHKVIATSSKPILSSDSSTESEEESEISNDSQKNSTEDVSNDINNICEEGSEDLSEKRKSKKKRRKDSETEITDSPLTHESEILSKNLEEIEESSKKRKKNRKKLDGSKNSEDCNQNALEEIGTKSNDSGNLNELDVEKGVTKSKGLSKKRRKQLDPEDTFDQENLENIEQSSQKGAVPSRKKRRTKSIEESCEGDNREPDSEEAEVPKKKKSASKRLRKKSTSDDENEISINQNLNESIEATQISEKSDISKKRSKKTEDSNKVNSDMLTTDCEIIETTSQNSVINEISDDEEIQTCSNISEKQTSSKSTDLILNTSLPSFIPLLSPSDSEESTTSRSFLEEFYSNKFEVPTDAKNAEKRAYKMKMRFNTYWNMDRNKFYNESWGGEIYDHVKEKLSMPKANWDAPEDRRATNSRSYKSHLCDVCKRSGHHKKECPFKACTMCGSKRHQQMNCDLSCCLTCFGEVRKGFTNTCKNCSKWSNSKCRECNNFGHIAKSCPDLWRRYHLTTTANHIVKPSVPTTGPQWCSICATKGHLPETCQRKYNLSFQPNQMKIANYKNVYESKTNEKPPSTEYDFFQIHNTKYNEKDQTFYGVDEDGDTVSLLHCNQVKVVSEGAEAEPNKLAVVITQTQLAKIRSPESGVFLKSLNIESDNLEIYTHEKHPKLIISGSNASDQMYKILYYLDHLPDLKSLKKDCYLLFHPRGIITSKSVEACLYNYQKSKKESAKRNSLIVLNCKTAPYRQNDANDMAVLRDFDENNQLTVSVIEAHKNVLLKFHKDYDDIIWYLNKQGKKSARFMKKRKNKKKMVDS